MSTSLTDPFVPIREDEGMHFPIRPEDLPERSHHFDNFAIETSAARFVSFFKRRGRWCGFTLEELRTYYLEQGWDPNAMLYGLVGAWLHASDDDTDGTTPTWYAVEVFIGADGSRLYVTDRFIRRYAGKIEPRPVEPRSFKEGDEMQASSPLH